MIKRRFYKRGDGDDSSYSSSPTSDSDSDSIHEIEEDKEEGDDEVEEVVKNDDDDDDDDDDEEDDDEEDDEEVEFERAKSVSKNKKRKKSTRDKRSPSPDMADADTSDVNSTSVEGAPNAHDATQCPQSTPAGEASGIQGQSQESTTEPISEEEAFQKRKRKKTSSVWEEFKDIKLADGTKKSECIWCKGRLAVLATGSTTHLKRHLDVCTRRVINKKNQMTLSLVPSYDVINEVNVTTFKYDNVKVRELLANWLLMHEHPFNIVEEVGFTQFCRGLTPLYQKISCTTARNDCLSVYEREKRKLQGVLKGVNKICLTTDIWKSTPQTFSYMVLTGHFIDSNWKLNKRVLNFVDIPPQHNGIDVSDSIYKCLVEWGIEDKVFSISVDNALYNDVAIRILRDDFSRSRLLLLGGKLFHVRCCAHILNLLVQDGLREIRHVIENVRDSVKFIGASEGRLKKFGEIVHQLRLKPRKLILDCPTRWNSTYDMLVVALQLKDVFPRFQDREPTYMNLPSPEDWKLAEKVCGVLKFFTTTTNIISGNEYPTANLFLSEVYRIKEVLLSRANDDDEIIRAMVKRMSEKFDEYWGECNLLMALGSIVDPRFKMRLVQFCFPLIYSKDEVETNLEKVRTTLYDLYNEYATSVDTGGAVGDSAGISTSNHGISGSMGECGEGQLSGLSQFDQYVMSVESVEPRKSDLESYLEEGVFRCVPNSDVKFCALEWWKLNNMKYPILSKMAADILAMPITTVASESTFSAGSRVIDPYRASLKTTIVEALMCGGDWMRQIKGVKKFMTTDDDAIKEFLIPLPPSISTI